MMALKNQELLQTWIKPWIIACPLCTAAMGMGFFSGGQHSRPQQTTLSAIQELRIGSLRDSAEE